MPNELKPCPFCGSEAWVIKMPYDCEKKYVVVCKNTDICEAAIGNYSKTKEEAIEAWNKRDNDYIDHLKAENERLKALIKSAPRSVECSICGCEYRLNYCPECGANLKL